MIFENLDKKFIKSYIRLYKGKKSNLLKISKDIKKIYYMYNEIVSFNLKYANYIQIIGFSIHPLENFNNEAGDYFSFTNEKDSEIFAFVLTFPTSVYQVDDRYIKIYENSSELLVFKSLGNLYKRNWICSVTNCMFNQEGDLTFRYEIVSELKKFCENLVEYDI